MPPEDIPFEEQRGGVDNTDSVPHHTHNHLTAARGTVSGHRIKKRGGLLSIFSSNKVRVNTCLFCNHYIGYRDFISSF